MKIRIKDNSLRLRLTQTEVDTFQATRKVACAIAFPNDTQLHYTLLWGTGDAYAARFDGQEIEVVVPDNVGKTWLAPTEVGMEQQVALPNGGSLRLLIEKDFACLTERVDEDESDMFPNPNANC